MPCECAPWYAGGTARTCDACKVEDLTTENAALQRENAALREALKKATAAMKAHIALCLTKPDWWLQAAHDDAVAALAPTPRAVCPHGIWANECGLCRTPTTEEA